MLCSFSPIGPFVAGVVVAIAIWMVGQVASGQDIEPPSAVPGVELADASANEQARVRVEWLPATDNVGVVEYEVRFGPGDVFTTADLFVVVDRLTFGTVQVEVRARDAAVNWGPYSAVVQLVTVDLLQLLRELREGIAAASLAVQATSEVVLMTAGFALCSWCINRLGMGRILGDPK
jgi:hypothetical protein